MHCLDLPDFDQEVYYFFHQDMKCKQKIFIERRVKNLSVFQLEGKKVGDHVLLGGTRLFYVDKKLHMEPISAVKIETKPVGGDFQTIQEELPFLVVRSFGEEGVEIKEWQRMKMGKVLLKIDEVIIDLSDV